MTAPADPRTLAAYWSGYCLATQRWLPPLVAAREEAVTDPLTQLRNRRAAELHVRAAALGGVELWAGLVDVRDLKKVNDAEGHSAGDRLLRAVAAALSQVADSLPGALLARYGGDEFLLCLHDNDLGDPGQPERVGQLIHTQLAVYGASHPDQHQPQVSIGWASTRQEGPAGDVLEAAGIALTAAKRVATPADAPFARGVRHEGRPPLPSRSATDHPRIPSQRASKVSRTAGSHRA